MAAMALCLPWWPWGALWLNCLCLCLMLESLWGSELPCGQLESLFKASFDKLVKIAIEHFLRVATFYSRA